MNNAEMLYEYLLADEDIDHYAHSLSDLALDYGGTPTMSSEFKEALDAEVLRKLMHYKNHCTIETATDMVPHTRKYLAWGL